MSKNFNLTKVIMFFKVFQGDEIVFENDYCGKYTDHYSLITNVGISTLRVKVSSNFTNPDCVDNNNLTDVSIDSIRNIIPKASTFQEFEIDGKITSLKAFLSENKIYFNSSEQNILENLLKKFELYFNKINSEGANLEKPINRKINRVEFNNLFIDLN
ncbi:hypothetical protein [Bizionia sp.]|uniref:hypothetical protein n=1 Tax=Bizionia sp. TaxID=1954480 RepID=UPI003A9120DF